MIAAVTLTKLSMFMLDWNKAEARSKPVVRINSWIPTHHYQIVSSHVLKVFTLKVWKTYRNLTVEVPTTGFLFQSPTTVMTATQQSYSLTTAEIVRCETNSKKLIISLWWDVFVFPVLCLFMSRGAGMVSVATSVNYSDDPSTLNNDTRPFAKVNHLIVQILILILCQF